VHHLPRLAIEDAVSKADTLDRMLLRAVRVAHQIGRSRQDRHAQGGGLTG
jgi:hypothetical protein